MGSDLYLYYHNPLIEKTGRPVPKVAAVVGAERNLLCAVTGFWLPEMPTCNFPRLPWEFCPGLAA